MNRRRQYKQVLLYVVVLILPSILIAVVTRRKKRTAHRSSDRQLCEELVLELLGKKRSQLDHVRRQAREHGRRMCADVNRVRAESISLRPTRPIAEELLSESVGVLREAVRVVSSRIMPLRAILFSFGARKAL
jgi:hypothetical protein